jgi:hypothetical protein
MACNSIDENLEFVLMTWQALGLVDIDIDAALLDTA